MPSKKDGKRHARRSKPEPKGVESKVHPSRDRTARHSDSDGARSGCGSFDKGRVRYEGANTEEGAERVALFYTREKDRPRRRSGIRKKMIESTIESSGA